jgi:hypothetical protein
MLERACEVEVIARSLDESLHRSIPMSSASTASAPSNSAPARNSA